MSSARQLSKKTLLVGILAALAVLSLSLLLFCGVDEKKIEFVHTGIVKDISLSPSKVSDDGTVLEYCADIVFEDGYRPCGICYDYAVSDGYTGRNIGKNCTLYRVYDSDGWCAIGYTLKC